ncbi:MAG: BACON domain-containing protein [Dysgonamonadaceae bacterium]|jgi:hypothetical protein|nr:BACON domain-containing protein [Dysgonamonadaceae bacterium]
MKKAVYYILFVFIAIAAFACSDENADGSFHRVEVASSNVTFNSAGGTGEIVLKTPNVTATSSESWCRISVSGTTISVSVEPNLSLEERTALVYLSADGLADYQIPVSQSGVKMKTIGMRTLDGIGEDAKFAYEADFPLEVAEIEGNWLQATIEGDSISLTAIASDNRDDTRSTIVWLVPQGQTVPRIPLSITQNKRPKYLLPLEYEDYLGVYELAYGTTYNASTRTKTTRVELVRGADNNTYYLKGILKDESTGNIVFKYLPEENGIITITAQKFSTGIPGDATKDAWILMFYSSANTVSSSTANSLGSGNFSLTDGLVFDMVHHTSSSSTVVIGGFTLRTYPTGTSSGNASWSAGAANGDYNYCYTQFRKIE